MRGGIDLPLDDRPVPHLPHVGAAARAHLVHPDIRVQYQRVPCARIAPVLRNQGRPRRVGHADHLAAHAGGIRQRAEQIHDRGTPQLLADRTHVPHRRVVRGREEEHHAGGLAALPRRVPAGCVISIPSASRTSAEPEREVKLRFPCFATRTPAPATTKAAAVEMLSVPTRPPPVPQVSTVPSPSAPSRRTMALPQRGRGAGDFVRRLALGPKPHQQGCGLHRSRLPAHDHLEGRGGLVAGQEAAFGEPPDGAVQRGIVGHEPPVGIGVEKVEKPIRRDALLSIMTRICAACSGVPARLDSGPMSRTYLATLQFDGTGFVGWQRQAAGRSVQVEVERVLERLFGAPHGGPRRRPHRRRRSRRGARRLLPRPVLLERGFTPPRPQRAAPA